jgi:hypothetical protein
MLFILIPTVWLCVLTFVLSLCMIAAQCEEAGGLGEDPAGERRAGETR